MAPIVLIVIRFCKRINLLIPHELTSYQCPIPDPQPAQHCTIVLTQSKDNNDFFAHLDLSIQRHNQIEDPEVTESVLKDDNNPSPSFKLWGYFLQQAESLASKLEHERVKGWLKIVQTILRETDKKIKAN